MKVGHLDPAERGVCPVCGWERFSLDHWLECVDPDRVTARPVGDATRQAAR